MGIETTAQGLLPAPVTDKDYVIVLRYGAGTVTTYRQSLSLIGSSSPVTGGATSGTALSYTASLPLAITAGNIALQQSGASVGQALVWSAGGWVPGNVATNYSLPVGTPTTLGGVKPDGTSLTTTVDGTLSVVGTSIPSLFDAGVLGATDALPIDRAGVDYKTPFSSVATFVRKMPAGGRSPVLATGSTTVTLTAADNDATIIVTGIAGTLTTDGTLPAWGRLVVQNLTSGTLTLSGITDPTGATTIAQNATVGIVRDGGSTVRVGAPFSSGGSSTPATAYTLAQAATTGATGTAVQQTLNPVGGLWKPGIINLNLTLAATIAAVSGCAVSGSNVTPNSLSGPAVVAITPSSAGTMTTTPTNTMGLTDPAALSYTVTGTTTYTSLIMTTPTYVAGKWAGTQALATGTGAASGISAPVTGRSVGKWIYFASAGAYNTFMQLTGWVSIGTAYNVPEIDRPATGNTATGGGAPSTQASSNTMTTPGWHWIVVQTATGTNAASLYLDGALALTGGGVATQTAAANVTIDPVRLGANGAICEIAIWNDINASRYAVPTGPLVRDAGTVAIWRLNGNGTAE